MNVLMAIFKSSGKSSRGSNLPALYFSVILLISLSLFIKI